MEKFSILVLRRSENFLNRSTKVRRYRGSRLYLHRDKLREIHRGDRELIIDRTAQIYSCHFKRYEFLNQSIKKFFQIIFQDCKIQIFDRENKRSAEIFFDSNP